MEPPSFLLIYFLMFIFLAGFVKVLTNKNYFLVSLLGLEFMGVGVYFLSSWSMAGLNESYYINFYVLSMMVCESSLGLSLLVMLSHSKNSSQVFNKLSLLC